MPTLDELIAQERKTAEHYHKMYEYECSRYGKKTVDSGVKLDCVKEYEYHSQIVELLEELKKRRSEDYGYMADIHQSIGYRQAIDDFVETLVSAFDETNIKEYGFYPENLVRQVAKQLKAGVKNETN